MQTSRHWTPEEWRLLEDGYYAGKLDHEIQADLSAAGYFRSVNSVQTKRLKNNLKHSDRPIKPDLELGDGAYVRAMEAAGFPLGSKAFVDIDIPVLMTTPVRAVREVPVGGSSLAW